MSKAISELILAAVDDKMMQGDTFKIRHTETVRDVICTPPDKDAAMSVTRVSNGWIYHCHRCHTSGIVYSDSLNPKQTRARVEAAKNGPKNRMTANITLPVDFEPMTDEESCPVPYDAWHWFWKYGLTNEDIMKYNVGWSANFNRVIIPLYEYAQLGDELAHKLVGWIGREIECQTKEERKRRGIVKYMTKSKKGRRRYFQAPGHPDTVVICEDALSAMNINIATGYTVIALLNTAVSNDLMRFCRGKKVYLWLDGDMLAHSVQTVNRMRSLGLNAKNIHTPKDPKEYNSLFIREQIHGKADV
jgi:hypothetical protein